MPQTTKFERGYVFAGYRIDELIGRGGMGMVYRATNVALNRIYALKVLAPELLEDERFQERFRREIRVAASLQHPNVVGIHYAGEHEGLLFLAMDYVHGTDLREILKKSGALHPERAVELLSQAASAIDAAHARGLIHRDVKPANILITVKDGEERAYLTDFGVAKRFDTVADLTATGVVVGTVDYMAPEQITGGHVDARTDIYALGCVFFQMLSGHVPYERDNSVAKLFAHVSDPPPSIEGELAELYPTFGQVVEKAMAKDPADRYLSAGDFLRDAAAALRGRRYSGPASVVAVGEAKPSASAGGEATGLAGSTQLKGLRPPAPGEQQAGVPPAAPTEQRQAERAASAPEPGEARREPTIFAAGPGAPSVPPGTMPSETHSPAGATMPPSAPPTPVEGPPPSGTMPSGAPSAPGQEPPAEIPRGGAPPGPAGRPRRRLALAGGGIVVLLIVAGIAAWLATKGGNSASKSTAMTQNPIMQALSHANSDPASIAKHYVPPSTCKSHGASKVTCSNPHAEAYSATFTTYPSLQALYAAYKSQLNGLADPHGFNWGTCGPKGPKGSALNLAAGESGWNHMEQHPKQYTLQAAESGNLNEESQLAGRVFCAVPSGQNAESIVWTQNSGRLLGVVSGPIHDVYDWWYRVHHQLTSLGGGPGMNMSGSGSNGKMSKMSG
jgi:tRNA A-37 threonylcarbamoyl transferase component Bud32